ncbi:hypothetical protein, partial [Mycobacterium tuberculosis]|uniref:hypothetical protein n=1 Tax=Mycobacterium tuberculosis TaxID=1773 RepID=UPI001BDB9716
AHRSQLNPSHRLQGCHAANLHAGPDITCHESRLTDAATTSYPQSRPCPQPQYCAGSRHRVLVIIVSVT